MEKLNGIIWSWFFLPCLLCCGLWLTARCGALQFRRFGQAMRVAFRGESDRGKEGISPLQAASTALASTLGTGNIIGTAQAIAMGGMGAVFWLWIAALLGMVIKYAEILLALRFQIRDGRGNLAGGPMYYIEKGLGRRFRPLGIFYAFFAALSVLSMGNMAQMNGAVASITGAVAEFRPLDAGSEFRLRLFLGLALSASAGIILAGDAKRVGKVTTFLVPLMSGAFLLLTLLVIICHAEKLPGVLGGIVREAFLPRSALGAAGGLGLREALHWGVRRGAFSNEAGLGSAAIAHGSARAGLAPEHALWGIFEVFADTILLCTLTALAILCSGVPIPYGSAPGPELLRSAFAGVFGGKSAALFMAMSLFLFGFSTVLGCSVYGLRCAEYLFGGKGGNVFRLLFPVCALLGSVMSTGAVWAAADTVNAIMALPNFIALFALSGLVGRETQTHFFGKKSTRPAE